MPYCCPETIQQFLRRYGWTFKRVNHHHVQTGWSHKGKIYNLDVHLTDTFICFQVKIVQLIESLDRKLWLKTTKHLLSLNDRVRFIRISIDSNLHVCASVEILRKGFTFHHLEHTLGILAYYTERIETDLKGGLKIE